MTREQIEKAADNYSVEIMPAYSNGYFERYQIADAFESGANWRINNVWHKPNEEPVSFCSLLLIENSNGEFDLGYKFDPANTKRWAYVKDLIPDTED